mmetsp:Transcript_1245/g.2505  ORF Transcript_1245/g.2505 Transcript_1245/m.2505 type:complete len:396 (+) Transcript_1245:69-1256(+)
MSSIISKVNAALASPPPLLGRALRSSSSNSLGTSPDSGVKVETVDSDLDEDVASQATTYSATTEDWAGRRYLSADACRVILATKVEVGLKEGTDKRKIVCSNPATCTRPKHQVLRQDPDKVAPPGYYLFAKSNKSNTDAVLDTLVTQAEVEHRRETDRNAATEMFSPQGVRLEDSNNPDTSPSTITFGAAEQVTPRKLDPGTTAAPKKSSLKNPPMAPPAVPQEANYVTEDQFKSALKAQMEEQTKVMNSQMNSQLNQFQQMLVGVMAQMAGNQGTKATSPRDNPKFYAIRQGGLTAIVKDLQKFHEFLQASPQAEHQVFDTEQEAQQWLATPTTMASGRAAGRTAAPHLQMNPPSSTHTTSTTQSAPPFPSTQSVVHIRGNGPDPSAGKPNEIW